MQLEAHASGHGHVEAVLHRRAAPRDVAGHRARGVELRRAPLDEHAAERVGVVARPELVRIAQEAEVHVPTTRGAGLHHDLRTLRLELREKVVEADRVVVPEVRLAVGLQVGGAGVDDVLVAVPLHVGERVYLRVHGVELVEDVLTHGRVRVVEHHLRAAASEEERAVLLAEDPVGMRLGEPALYVAHFRLHPEAELEPALGGLVREPGEAVRQLRGIHHPVAEAGLVAVLFVAGVLALPEPAVVEDEHLAAHFLHAVHHVGERLLRKAEVGAFPRVEQNRVQHVAVRHQVAARPAVVLARHLALALLGPHDYCPRRGEGLAGVEDVRPRLHVDSSENIRLASIPATPYALLSGAGPFQRHAENLAVFLIYFVAKAHHHRRVRLPGVARARERAVLRDLSVRDGRLRDVPLKRPHAREREHLHDVGPAVDPRGEAIGAEQPHRTRLIVAQLVPRLDGVAVLPRPHKARDIHGIVLVLQLHRHDAPAIDGTFLPIRLLQPKRHRAVRMDYLETSVFHDFSLCARNHLPEGEQPGHCNVKTCHIYIPFQVSRPRRQRNTAVSSLAHGKPCNSLAKPPESRKREKRLGDEICILINSRLYVRAEFAILF